MTDVEQVEIEEGVEGSLDGELESAIPVPCGYMILIALPEVQKTYKGTNIEKSEESIRHDTILSMVGLVLDMGPQAYSDKDRYPTGPWCKVGDYVMFRQNTGTRFKVNGQEMRLLNDDSIQAVVANPTLVERV